MPGGFFIWRCRRNELAVKPEKTMTTRELAEALGVSADTIKNCIRRIMPDKMQHGKATLLNETEVACISSELKNNDHVLDKLTGETVSRVENSTTELEILANARSAFMALDELYRQKEAEYKSIIAQKDSQLEEQRPMVEGYARIADSSGLKTIQEVADILGYGSRTYFAMLRGLGILYTTNGVNLPKRSYIDSGYFVVKEEPYERNGNTYLYSRIYVTSKGLLWLEKKTPRTA